MRLLSPGITTFHPGWPYALLCLLGQREGGADEEMVFSTCMQLFSHRVDLVILNSCSLMSCIKKFFQVLLMMHTYNLN